MQEREAGESDGHEVRFTTAVVVEADVATRATPNVEDRARVSGVGSSAERPPLVDENGQPMLELMGRYRDTGLVGRGGMGAVRSLHDATLRREVAAKTLDPQLAVHPEHVQGFVEEAQITAQLDHPNIVPVYELGTDVNGTLFFTMKRVRGKTFHALLQEPDLPLGSSERLSVGLEVVLKVCDALAFAHSRGVLHRDIKPDNVMVGAFGAVYLMDWGLAKVMRERGGTVDVPRDPTSPLARAGEGVVGTPQFLAPEMANRLVGRVDERVDVFGIGTLLYQLVTGRLPYGGATVDEVLERARACSFVAPDAFIDVFVPGKLVRVITKAMARNPEDRYPTVGELAAQVREFLHRGHHLPRKTHPEGALIVKEGDPGEHAYIITRGRCEVFREVAGRRQVLRELGPGSVFGESAILGSAPRSASVVALSEVATLVLTRELLEEKLPPDTWEGLLARTLIERFRELDAERSGRAGS